MVKLKLISERSGDYIHVENSPKLNEEISGKQMHEVIRTLEDYGWHSPIVRSHPDGKTTWTFEK